MGEPLDRVVGKVPSTIGGGCSLRFDPDALSAEHGTEFPGADALWRALAMQGQPGQISDMDGQSGSDPL